MRGVNKALESLSEPNKMEKGGVKAIYRGM
jgi:hypothetical protein